MLIAGGRLVDPIAGIDALRDIRISDVVTEIGEHLDPRDGEQTLDASGAVVAPGFIDMHVHLREPGNLEKERIESGTEAAVRGGFVAVACMPNTDPPLDDAARVTALLERIRTSGRCRVYPIATITRGRRGEETCDFRALSDAGAVAFSDDGDWVADREVMERACAATVDARAPFISHCEPEVEAVERDIALAAQTGRAWHIAHVSTKRAVELLRAARAAGTAVTAEATPHHLLCTAQSAQEMGAAAAVNPPLQSEEDRRALCDAVRDGTIDALASDHAPHTVEQKAQGAPGFSGLEVALGAYASALPGLPLARFVSLLSVHPARILGVDGGSLGRGARADVTIFRDAPWRVNSATFASLGRVTPFEGMTFPRRAVATIVGGDVMYRA